MAPATLTDAPRGSRFQAFDCARCQFEELLHPVWVSVDGGAPTPYGTHCAAVVLGLVPETAGRREAARAVRDAQAARAAAEAAERKVRSDARAAAWFAFLTEAAGPGDVGEQIKRLGGFAAASALFEGRDNG